MTLADITQMQVDLRNGVMLASSTIDKLIQHALMRESEDPNLRLANQNLRNENYYLKQQLAEAKAMATKQGEEA